MMDAIQARARRQLDRLHDLSDDLAAIRIRVTTPDGSISVEVDGNGTMVDLAFSQTISRMSAKDFSSTLVTTAIEAARKAIARRADLVEAFNIESAEIAGIKSS